MFGESFFKKIEGKTNVSKETIMSLASKLQNNNMKDEGVLRDLVKEIGSLAGKDVSKEKEDKIVNAILKDNVPTDIDKMI
ncbi:MAG: stage VI sporulation protein F [Bacilli bacterium]